MEEIQNNKKIFVIRDLETLKVIADPLRTQIMELLAKEPLTVGQVAEKLGLASSRLYYHFNLLEKHGLILVVETHVIANIIEKEYRAAARRLDVDPALLNFSTETGQENIFHVVAATIEATREDLIRSLQARSFALEQGEKEQPRRADIDRVISRIPEQTANEFQERLNALIREFEAADVEGPGSDELQAYALTVAFYPSFYFQESRKEQ